MRVLSCHERYSICLFKPSVRRGTDRTGTVVEFSEGEEIDANFQHTGLLDHEALAALDHFSFHGLPEGVNPLRTISVFDSESFCEQYPEEQREDMQGRIDNRLEELAPKFPSMMLIVDQPRAPKPWETYDEMEPEDILTIREQTGTSPEAVRIYEIENANRDEIVEAMLRIEDPEGAEREFGAEESVGEPIPVQA